VGEFVDFDLGLAVLLGEIEEVVLVVLVQVQVLVRGLAHELDAMGLGHMDRLDPHARVGVRVVGRQPKGNVAVLGLDPRFLRGQHERLVDVLGHKLRALALLVLDRDTDAERRGERLVCPPASSHERESPSGGVRCE
jgi:hypothetical protein